MPKAGANDGENGRYAPWCEDVAAVVAHLRTDVEAGLSADEAEVRCPHTRVTRAPSTQSACARRNMFMDSSLSGWRGLRVEHGLKSSQGPRRFG